MDYNRLLISAGIPLNTVLLIFLATMFFVVQWDQDTDAYTDVRPQILEENTLMSLQYNMNSLADVDLYRGSDENTRYKLSDLATQPKLVYRFSGMSCDVCIEETLEQLEDRFEKTQVILVTSELNPRLRANYYWTTVYSTISKYLGIELEEYSIPFLFFLDSQLKARELFIPDKNYPYHTDVYLKNNKEVYFNIKED